MTISDLQQKSFFKDLQSLPKVEVIWLFGSRARGKHQDRADIDLAIACPQATASDWLDILTIIDNADTLLKIDCVRLDDLQEGTALKQAILSEGIRLYERH